MSRVSAGIVRQGNYETILVLCILVKCNIVKALPFHFATNKEMKAITKALNMTLSPENVMHVLHQILAVLHCLLKVHPEDRYTYKLSFHS